MRENVTAGPAPFRRAYIRSVINQVEVGDPEISIIGRSSTLERLVMGGSGATQTVPSFVPKWHGGSDSNFSVEAISLLGAHPERKNRPDGQIRTVSDL
jgi:site-specific DNA recombinase